MEPARSREVFAGERLKDELGRCPRREPGAGVEDGGARRLEVLAVALGLAARCWAAGGFNWD